MRQATDVQGAVTAAREWTPYGVEIGDAQPGLGYAGEWFDADVEAQYLRARWYDVATGRFTSRDPWEGDYERPQSLNGWVYVEGNPIRYIDPTGYRPLVPPGIPTPPIVSRSEWGAMKPGKHYVLEGRFQTGRVEGFYDPVDNVAGYASYSDLYPDDSLADILYAIVIHHEGNSQTYDIWQVQWKHMVENGWTDIGYHFAVDPSGIIYEGRDINVRGCHVQGKNTGRIGVLLLGDFQPGPDFSICGITIFRDKDDPGPSTQQVRSTLHLIRWLDYLYGIEEVVGHRDLNPTECPGDYCVPYIPLFNEAAQER